MPKTGMAPKRRRAFVEAAIRSIHDRGFMDLTTGDIAREAGVSQGLLHHYFGSKSALIIATMRHLLIEFGAGIRERLRRAETPRARLSAIVDGSFCTDQLRPEVISAWLTFYVQAHTEPEVRRLLHIYARRLISNLRHDYRRLPTRETADVAAESTAAMIDGLWLRRVLGDREPCGESAIAIMEAHIDSQLETPHAPRAPGARSARPAARPSARGAVAPSGPAARRP